MADLAMTNTPGATPASLWLAMNARNPQLPGGALPPPDVPQAPTAQAPAPMPPVPPAKKRLRAAPPPVSSPSPEVDTSRYDELSAALDPNNVAGFQDQQKGLADLEEQLKAARDKTPGIDFSPLLAYHDSKYGTALQKGYSAPEDQNALDQKALQLQEALQKGKQNLTHEQISLLNDALGAATKKVGFEENAKAREQQTEANNTTKQYLAQLRTGEGSTKAINTESSKLGHELVSGTASSRSDFGKQQGTVTNADKILQLGIQGDSQIGGLDTRQIHEIAIASAGLVSNGNAPAQSTIEALVPHTGGEIAPRIEEWLTGNPTGVEQQAFVKRMLETADRERFLANEKIKKTKSEIIAGHEDSLPSEVLAKHTARHFSDDDLKNFNEHGIYQPQPYIAPNKKTSSSAPAPAGPKVGDVVDGFKFNGGDPSKKESWSKT